MQILFLDMSTKLESIHDLETRARGGMVSSLFHVSDGLSRIGHDVSVLSDIAQPGMTSEGVSWLDAKTAGEISTDVLVCNRGVGYGYPDINAKKRILWTHDLPHNGFIPEPKTIRAFSHVVFMSKYAERIWRSFYKTIGKSAMIPNGVDKTIFRPATKDPGYLIYISAPNRGLNRLPLIFDAIRSRSDMPIRMKAFSNMASLHPNEVRTEKDGFYCEYKNCVEAGIDLHDPIPQKELGKELGQAGLMLLPTDYPEICSNSILQALSCGVPVITTGNIGSAGEWVKHGYNGMLTKWHPVDFMVYQVEIVRNAISVLNRPRVHKRMMRKAAKTKTLTWGEVTERWDRMLRKSLRS